VFFDGKVLSIRRWGGGMFASYKLDAVLLTAKQHGVQSRAGGMVERLLRQQNDGESHRFAFWKISEL
jgi:hypothetical protein